MIEWIDVKKELPEYYGDVLVCGRRTRAVTVAHLCEGDEYDGKCEPYFWEWVIDDNYGYFDLDDITHWAHINAPESGKRKSGGINES